MNNSTLEKWKKSWIGEKNIVLWGYGQTCRYFLDEFKEHLSIEAIIDNDISKNGTVVNGIPIVHPDHIDLHDKKIVVTTYYEDICSQLEKEGLKEYTDFCDIRTFICGKSWFENNQVVINELHIAITTGCTLNCKYCNMYMPFHKKVTTYSFEEIKCQIDLIFKFIDRIVKLVLLGGEPLINRELSEVIEYLQSSYSGKFDKIEIITNGTIVPNESLISVLKAPDIVVTMSNYDLNDTYRNKFTDIRNILDENGIITAVNKDLRWKDFSFPYSNLNLPDEQAYKNMHKCNPVFRGFNDSKFYFCHLVWSSDKAGISKEQPDDYIDLSKSGPSAKESIVLMNMCCFDNTYNSLCKDCGGCSNLNQKYIKTGEQI